MNANHEELLYAYAVTRDAGAPGADDLETLTGVAGEPVRAVRHLGLATLVGPVPAAGFGEAALHASLEDIACLEKAARAHQRVIDAVTATGACVLPMRLATVYHDEAGVRRMLANRHAQLGAALDRLDGCVEWGVKVHASGSAAQAPAATGAGPRAPRAAVSGRDYLRRRAAARHAHEEEARREDEAARGIHAVLTALAEQTRLYPPQHGPLAGPSGRNILNAAYLVRREGGDRFTSAVAGFADLVPEDGVRLELTGPWAPYSFAGQATSGQTGTDQATSGQTATGQTATGQPTRAQPTLGRPAPGEDVP
ncbi:gas vesicle protein [Streptosporangium nondiastaticum]|uniref:Gas vesicle protein n=1 Tax=Streptosporangium nondiastaticum TaxID=35764 RepID=A0A9X7JUC9_9ACTN|nr:GvpL/GvpF family gas vesicle protein [Streptosporangium nondiastaticum]PSJ30078.1 gas vesicle protein [Streptosporangium nondiastaticum]